MMNCDLLIIGAGPGGYRAAEYAAKHGLQVVIVEQDEVGGTCLNRGCIPTKTYVHAATFTDAFERQQQVVAQLRTGVEGILSAPNITLLRGHACFLDTHTVQIDSSTCSNDSITDSQVTAKNIIIATGSSAKMPPIPDIGDPRVVTSTELLQRPTLPKRLAIIGAGVIGMEFASVFQRFGSEVTVIEYLKECLPMLDSDIAKRLRKLLEKRGITFKMKTAVQSLADIDADVILIATGRKANTDGLNLEAAGIASAVTASGLSVDDNFCVTPSPLPAHIYAIGDVNGRQMLAHAAEMQALRAVNHVLGRTDGIRFDIMPAAIFTEPEAACVGSSEDVLKAEGCTYRCRKAFWRANGKALAMSESEGMLKLFSAPLPDGLDEVIIGCHAYGAHAADIIQEVSALICRDTTISQLRDIVHIHPTLGEILRTAAEL
ncbi:MAG: NAD(P)/FAD-dependent oxidoreductase [Prevotella sp.]|nr:NAD(P)/FAD-dependent oxidoreductase [Prevotella sp.]